jgi:hypothetical protein
LPARGTWRGTSRTGGGAGVPGARCARCALLLPCTCSGSPSSILSGRPACQPRRPCFMRLVGAIVERSRDHATASSRIRPPWSVPSAEGGHHRRLCSSGGRVGPRCHPARGAARGRAPEPHAAEVVAARVLPSLGCPASVGQPAEVREIRQASRGVGPACGKGGSAACYALERVCERHATHGRRRIPRVGT